MREKLKKSAKNFIFFQGLACIFSNEKVKAGHFPALLPLGAAELGTDFF